MQNNIVRSTALNGTLRVSSVITTNVIDEARLKHDTFPVATAALGRVITGTLLLSWGLKEEGTITVRVLGDGPLGGIIAIANSQGEVRGYVQEPHVYLPLNSAGKIDVGGGVGAGSLYITKDLGLERPYTGSTPLITGEIGDDLAKYLLDSEQTPSLVSLGVLVDKDNSVLASGGIIIQALPGAEEEALIKIEENLKDVKPISTLIKEGLDAKGLIGEYLKGIDIKILDEKPVMFKCECSKDKLENILISLGDKEIKDIVETEGRAEIRCHFCNEEYLFNKDDLEKLVEEINNNKNK
ncbi:molecular chaperone Hsp33 [Desulfonispora thiosulfatigenes DSM 11270]|uniref:33 kDa chaperonin n=1 Tax=Desulfonispora thiosulfatigenes DSM 11270 TaxID=656914 RepID=A0A1W1VJF7_DESTI|nr:Hsp33 family molecular chaperone HslO [Desulfonispora thiosulfatigenes]SMB93456.1 molecular chaperone Hsp33 [Desulfonispora thiosulfatigenes DSM 11270]